MAETLAAKTASLSSQMQADARARANSRTTPLIVPPVPASRTGIPMLLLAFPAFYTLIYGT